ncbi:MAG: hypothetical protein K2M02_05860 [Duncaniella sp.]|nr:hypothetical protein [Duncaniella sp.]
MRNHYSFTPLRGLISSLAFFAFILLNVLLPQCISAQNDSILRKHIIIAFDNALPETYKNYLLSSGQAIVNNADRLLQNHNAMPQTGDYVSVVNFAMGTDNASLKDFATPSIDSDNHEIAWREFKDWSNVFSGDWESIVYNQGINRSRGSRYSLLSGAKAFSVGALFGKNKGNDNNRVYANRTYLLLVSDDFHNGNDNFMKEFQVFKGMGARADEKEFRGVCNEFARNYIAELIAETPIATSGQLPYRLMLYEIRPAATTSLAGVVNYPASLNLKRVPGGYSMEFDAASVDNLYALLKLQVDVVTVAGDTITCVADATSDGEPLHIDLQVDKDDLDPDNVPVTVRGWLLQNDSIYNAYLWNPYDVHASRLTTHATLRCNDKGSVFGIALPDSMWWFYRDDIRMAAFLWEVIFVLLIVIAVVAVIIILNKRSLRYTPLNSEFSIRRAGQKK